MSVSCVLFFIGFTGREPRDRELPVCAINRGIG